MEINKIIVHDGIFHADDVMCVAIAKMINSDVEVERVRIAPRETEEGIIVCDIGGGKYDHHQKDAETREDGNKYAACGLLLRDCWKDILPNWEAYERFNKSVIMPIEDADNGVKKNELSAIISSYIPPRGSRRSMDQAFSEAVDFMKGYLDRYIEREIVREKTEILVKSELNEMDKRNGNVVMLPESIPCNYLLVPSNAKYYVAPEDRGGWGLWCVPEKLNSYKNKASLPEEWLKNPPKGCSFIHNNRFLATFRDFNDLKAVVKELTGEEINNDRKYELVKDDVVSHLPSRYVSPTSVDLYKVKYIKDFETVTGLKIHAGDLGGYIEGEWNLSQYDNSYVGENAWVWDKARVDTDGIVIGGEVNGEARIQNGGVVVNSYIKENAIVDGGTVIDQSTISGCVCVTDHAIVGDGSELSGKIEVKNHEEIYGEKASSMEELWGGIKPGIGKDNEAIKEKNAEKEERKDSVNNSNKLTIVTKGLYGNSIPYKMYRTYRSNEDMTLWERTVERIRKGGSRELEKPKTITTEEMLDELKGGYRTIRFRETGDYERDVTREGGRWKENVYRNANYESEIEIYKPRYYKDIKDVVLNVIKETNIGYERIDCKDKREAEVLAHKLSWEEGLSTHIGETETGYAVLTTKEVTFENPKMLVEALDYRKDDRGITTSYIPNEKMNLWEKNYSIYAEDNILDEYDGKESGQILTTKEMITELDSFGRVCDATSDEEVEVYQVGGDTSYDISYQDNKWVVAKYEGMKDDKIHIFSSMEDAISDIKDEIEGMREDIEFDDFEL